MQAHVGQSGVMGALPHTPRALSVHEVWML